jgi:hypothetical protein
MTVRISGTNTTAAPGFQGGDSDTGIRPGTNEIEFVTGGSVAATFNSSGNLVFPDTQGIDFSASEGSGSSSSILDDYEEGTFTPVFRGATTAGTYTGTFNGYYTRIGNRVFIEIQLSNITASSAGSGSAQVGGLPYTSAQGGAGATGSMRYDVWNYKDTADGLVPIVSNGNDYIQIYEVGDDVGDSATDVGDITSGSTDVFISACYRV